jgi:hypothetical protein
LGWGPRRAGSVRASSVNLELGIFLPFLSLCLSNPCQASPLSLGLLHGLLVNFPLLSPVPLDVFLNSSHDDSSYWTPSHLLIVECLLNDCINEPILLDYLLC